MYVLLVKNGSQHSANSLAILFNPQFLIYFGDVANSEFRILNFEFRILNSPLLLLNQRNTALNEVCEVLALQHTVG